MGSVCIIGCVNLYQKFEIEKYIVCGKLILPQKNGKAFLKKKFWHKQASCVQHF